MQECAWKDEQKRVSQVTGLEAAFCIEDALGTGGRIKLLPFCLTPKKHNRLVKPIQLL